MSVFEKSAWIWKKDENDQDCYCEFYGEFDYLGGDCVCNISCDGDYTLYINGNFFASNQYPDFEHHKIYDQLDLTITLNKGKNKFAVLVWHFGNCTQRTAVYRAGFIFEVVANGNVLLSSGEKTLVRKSKAYESGRKRSVTPQLGFGFKYDATRQDDWVNGNASDFELACIVDKPRAFFKRENKKLILLPEKQVKILSSDGVKTVIDLGEETVGLVSLRLVSSCEQLINVAYGERLVDGHVPRIILKTRDFSFDYVATKGRNEYINYMFRFGCRYLEVESEQPVEIEYVGIIPQVYPTKEKKGKLKDAYDQKIYDLCVRTLKLCMMERYVDCPWREQCLYTFDARNQMLFGYHVYQDKNAEYARSNLTLIGQDRRDDGLLSICFPCTKDMTITSFSLQYILAVKEYVEYTGDISIFSEVGDKLKSLIDTFVAVMQDGLVNKFKDKKHWNFYDWSPFLEGTIGTCDDEPIPDIAMNSLFVMAINAYEYLCDKAGKEFEFKGLAEKVRKKAEEKFFVKKDKLFSTACKENDYTELGNALAILAGIKCDGHENDIAQAIVSDKLHKCSLSNKIAKFTALLTIDKEKYKDIILKEIRSDFKVMFDGGATSLWETLRAENSVLESMCHAWSAVPVYIFNLLGMVEYE